MRNVDNRLIAASRNLGATGVQTFWRIYLPLTRPGLFASSLLVFIMSLGFYVVPAILGGGKVMLVAEYVYVQVLVILRWGTASMLAIMLLLGVLLLLLFITRFIKLSAVLGGERHD